MLELGVHPGVSAASAQAAMVLSSSAASVVYLLSGALPFDYTVALAIVGAVATLFGQLGINYIVRRTGRCSIVVSLLAALFVVAIAAAVSVLIINVVNVVRHPYLLTAANRDAVCARHA